MKRKSSVIVLLITLLLSLTVGACKGNNDSGGASQAPVQSTTIEKEPEVQQDNSNTDNSTAQEPNTNINQYTNNISTDKKPSTTTDVKLQVTNAAANPNPFHVSLNGKVGASAVRVYPGGSTLLQTEVYKTGGKYPITLTISRNGEIISVIYQNLNSNNSRVVLIETSPSQFRAQWD